MLDEKGFDGWSGGYDEDIRKRQGNEYPFEGYSKTLGYIQDKVKAGKAVKILDIGIGTGALTEILYGEGIEITGVDFSDKMLDLAKEKMPKGRFIKFDFNKGLPKEIEGETFNYIISSYAIHHIDDDQKIVFFKELIRTLNSFLFEILCNVRVNDKHNKANKDHAVIIVFRREGGQL
ncbi:MAG: class I SAM-dependent methyltransferase [candidate division Zixibacteria bacterium]|nr:class I SAM-dependent methyltransferase [candidate division Zixibacteria bacterium]